MKTYYTGVGSRETPPDILKLMTEFARVANKMGMVLRSGGADGADRAFELGADLKKEIYRPEDAIPDAFEIASRFHPTWFFLPEYIRKLHARNVFQVLGRDLRTLSKFLVCWTPDGCTQHKTRRKITGGTGTAISVASEIARIPIFNMATHNGFAIINEMVEKYGIKNSGNNSYRKPEIVARTDDEHPSGEDRSTERPWQSLYLGSPWQPRDSD